MDPSNALPTAYMSSIEVGATENELKVTFSNFGVSSVWHTTDAGANWANKDNGTLPDMPVRWIMTNPDNADEVILATEVGVWSTANFTNASPTWVPSNSGLANCRVDQLQLRIADNQVAAATHGRGLFTGNFFSPTFTNDAGITAVNSPVNHLVCTDTFTPSVTLKNFGSATLTQVDILYNLDGGGNTTYNWTGSLTGGSTTVVVLPSMSAATGLHTFNASTNLPNAVADEDTGNDASSSQFTATDTFVTVSIVTDAYGNETTWTITAPGGEVVGSGGPYAFQGANGAYPQPDVQVCLSSNLCYDMTVYDSFGDGMCCAYGNGSWTVKDTQGNTLVSGGTFLFSETANFCPPAPVVSNTYYSVASGNMSANIWSTTSGGAAGPAVFNCTTHLVIQNGTTVANDVGNFSALDFTVEPLGSFDLTSGGNVMSLCGNLDVDGTFIANDSKVDFQGSSAQTIGGSSNTVFYDIRLDNATGLTLLDEQSMIGGLDLQNGNFDASGATFHFVSTSTGTGRILEIQPGADYVGNMNAELNINSTSQGWRMMGMSVTGATLAQWSGDIPTTGFVGSDYPAYNFVNILSYDETLIGAQAHYDSGFVDVSNITDGLPDGEGRFVFVNGPDMCEVIGAPVKGTVSLTPSFTNSSTVLFNDGWNLAANSYQCTIDWDAATGWTRSDIDGTIYMWDNDLQQWATYTGGGVGVNGGSRYIAPQQGFWMKANAGGAVYSMTEAVKVDQYVAFVRENESFYSATIELAIYGNNWSDETALVVREGAELGFDPQYDGHKLRSTNESVPSLFTLSDDDEPLELSINTFGTLQEGQLIPLHFVVPADGEYTLSTSDFDPSEFGACLMLEDLITGESISLEPDMDYMLSAAAVDPSHRFNIVVGNTMETSALATYCPGSEDGEVVVTSTVADGTPVELYDQGDVLVATETLLNGEASFYGLGAGTYYAHVSGLVGECSELNKSFYIEQPQIATMEIVSSVVDGCNASGNGMLHAMLPLGNWDITLLKDEVVVESMIFGGGDLIFDALDAGLYEIIAENDCVALHIGADLIDKLEVEAYFDGPTTIYLQENPTVSFENQSVNGSEFMWQIGELTVYSEHIASYSFTEPGLYTIHLIAYNGTCVDEYEMDVEVIGEVVSLEEFASAGDQFEVFQNQNVIMVILGRDSDIERVIFHDLLGKQVAQMNISDGQQVTTLSSSIFSTGIYTVTAYSKTQRVASEKFFVLK